MNEQTLSLIRSILKIAGGVAVTKGWIASGTAGYLTDSSTLTMIAGVMAAIVPTIWSAMTHTTTGTIARAAALPEVSKIVTTPEIANSNKFALNRFVSDR